jgi:WD40 repeat protein
MNEPAAPDKCHTFICYRQSDGLAVAEWLFQRLHGREIRLGRSGKTLQLDVYFDQDAPAIDDWHEYWEPKLKVCRALVLVCTRESATRRDGSDWVYAELDYWLEQKSAAPIVVDAVGDGGLYVPGIVTGRWPNAQRIVCTPQAWSDDDTGERVEKRAIERILNGIRISEEGVYFEELEHLRLLNRDLQLETARAEQNEERATDARVNIQVNNGARAIDDGDLRGSAVWFCEALRVDAERHAAEDEHRVRLRAVARRLPVLEQVWFVGSRSQELRFLPDGVRLLAAGESLEIYDPRQPTALRLEESDAQPVILHVNPAGDTLLALSYRYRSGETIYELARWNLSTGAKTALHTSVEKILDVSPDGTFVVASSDGLRAMSLEDRANGKRPWAVPDGEWQLASLVADTRWIVAATEHELWARPLLGNRKPVQLGRFDHIDLLGTDTARNRCAFESGLALHVWSEKNGTWQAASFDVGKEVSGAKKIVDGDFNPDGEHIVVTCEQKDRNLTSLILRIAGSSTITVAGRVDHEQAVERWEHKPPSAGGGAGAVTAMGARIWNPFEKKARFAPDGRLLAAISDVDRHVRVWEWRSARPLTPPLEHFSSSRSTFAFGPNGTTIAAAYDDTIHLWSFAQPTGDALAAGSSDRVDELVFSPEGSTIAMAGYQPTPEIWRPHADGRELTLEGHKKAITAVMFSPDGNLVATGSYDDTVRVYDARTGRPICDPLPHTHAIDGVLFHSGSRLLTWSSGYDTPGEIFAWELPSGRKLGSLITASTATMAAWSPDGTRAAVALKRRSTYGVSDEERQATSRPLVWDVERNTTITLSAIGEQPEWVAFNDDDSGVWVYDGGKVEEFSAAGGPALRAYSINSPFPGLLAVTADGERIATGNGERQVQVVDRRPGRPLTPQMDHQVRSRVESACFSADGRHLLTVSREQVRVWSAATGRLLAPPFVHDVRVNRAVLDASGSRVVISTYPERSGEAGLPSAIQFWSLVPDARPIETLLLEAEVASTRHIDDAGGLVPLSEAQYRARWEALSASRQSIATDEADVDLWHLQQAAAGDGFGRRFHAGRLAARNGDGVSRDPAYLASRARVLAEAGHIDAAIADLSPAIGLRLDRRPLLAQRGQLHAERGDLSLALADLAEACDISSAAVGRAVRADDIKAVFAVAYLAAVLHESETYRAAARRAVRLLGRQDNPASREVAWNALFFAVYACTLAPDASLTDTEWRLLDDALRRRGIPHLKDNVGLLTAQIALRRDNHAATARALRGVKLPPWDHLVLALSHARHGRRVKAEELSKRARREMGSLAKELRSTHRESRPYAPGWPTHSQIAELLASELGALLESPG